jgi:hypothetical protein
MDDRLRCRAVGAPRVRSMLLTLLGEYVAPGNRSFFDGGRGQARKSCVLLMNRPNTDSLRLVQAPFSCVERPAPPTDHASISRLDATQQLDQCRLSRAVIPEERVDLSATQGQVDAGKRPRGPVPLGQTYTFESGLVRW